MKLKREFVLRQIAGDHLLIPVGKTALDMNGMLALDEMGAFLWKKLPQAQTEAELTDLVLAEYEADRATVEKDVAEFLDKLLGETGGSHAEDKLLGGRATTVFLLELPDYFREGLVYGVHEHLRVHVCPQFRADYIVVKICPKNKVFLTELDDRHGP